MRYKKMRRSGVEVSAVTVGTWAIGGANSLGGNYGEIDDAYLFDRIPAIDAAAAPVITVERGN